MNNDDLQFLAPWFVASVGGVVGAYYFGGHLGWPLWAVVAAGAGWLLLMAVSFAWRLSGWQGG